MAEHVVWDDPGGVLIPAPDCTRCGHKYGSHLKDNGRKKMKCTVGPFNDVVVQCPCPGYEAGPT